MSKQKKEDLFKEIEFYFKNKSSIERSLMSKILDEKLGTFAFAPLKAYKEEILKEFYTKLNIESLEGSIISNTSYRNINNYSNTKTSIGNKNVMQSKSQNNYNSNMINELEKELLKNIKENLKKKSFYNDRDIETQLNQEFSNEKFSHIEYLKSEIYKKLKLELLNDKNFNSNYQIKNIINTPSNKKSFAQHFLSEDSDINSSRCFNLDQSFRLEKNKNTLNYKEKQETEINQRFNESNYANNNKNFDTTKTNQLNNPTIINDLQENKILHQKYELSQSNSKIKYTSVLNDHVLTISSKDLFTKINMILQKFKVLEPTADIGAIFSKAFDHFLNLYESSRIEVDEKGIFKIFDLNKKTEDNKIVKKDYLFYHLFPSSLELKSISNGVLKIFNVFTENYLKINKKFPNIQIKLHENYEIDNNSSEKERDFLVNKRFLKFLIFFGNRYLIERKVIKNEKEGIPLVHIEKDKIDNFDELSNIYSHNLIKNIKEHILPFCNHYVDQPQGVIVYGPPSTAKTQTIEQIIDTFDLYNIFPQISASDFYLFEGGISNKVLDLAIIRADVIPWELCTIFIDNIQNVIHNSTNFNSNCRNFTNTNKLSSLFETQKKNLNLLIFGTINRLEQLDSNFKQNIKIVKIFSGVPNFKDRELFIMNHLSDFNRNNTNNNIISNILKDPILIKDLVNMSLNFSLDDLKNCLDKISINLELNKEEFFNKYTNSEKKLDYNRYLYDMIELFGINREIKIGKYILPSIIKEIQDDYSYYFQNKQFENFFKSAHLKNDTSSKFLFKKINYSTNKILVDLSDKNINKFFQVEVYDYTLFSKELLSSINNMNTNSLEELKDSINKFIVQIKESRIIDIKLYDEELIELKKILLNAYENCRDDLEIDNDSLNSEEIKNSFVRQLLRNLKNRTVLPLNYKGGYLNLKDALEVLIKIVLELNLNYVLFLDCEYFQKRNIFDEHKMAEELITTIEEAIKYNSAMIIFDLASLCGLTNNNIIEKNPKDKLKLYKNSEENKMNASNNHFEYRHLILQICLNYLETTEESKSNTWFIKFKLL